MINTTNQTNIRSSTQFDNLRYKPIKGDVYANFTGIDITLTSGQVIKNNGKYIWNDITELFVEISQPSRVHNQLLAGIMNGINNVYNVNLPFVNGSESVKYNGLVQTINDDYTITSTTTITMIIPPITGDKLLISYNPI
jgi:hypothetical protein